MGIKLIKKNESYESDLENIAQTSGEIDYGDAWKLNRAATKDPELRSKVRNLIGDWRSAAEDEDDGEMTKAAKALKTLADSLPKHEARMHLGRCKNCGSGWTKTNYLDELEPDARKYFKDKGYADNADICPKCVAAAKKYLAQGKAEGATYDEYVDAVAASLEDDFEYSPITALEFARDDFKDITKAFYSATKDPKEAAKEIDARYMGGNEGRKKAEGHEGWDDWEEVEGLEESIEGIESLAYELRHCIRGARTHCKDWKSLALYIKGLASNLDDAAELMAYKTDSDNDDESANESDNPVGELFDALKQALDGKGYKVSQFTSDKEFVGQEKPYDGISIENKDPNASRKTLYRIVLDTDANLFRIFFPGVRRKSITGQPGSISGIVKFILRDLNLDESASEDRRGTDRYGHPVKRFTTKDLKGVGDGSGDDAGADNKFGLAYLDTTSIDAFSNNFSTSARDSFLHDLAQMPVSKKSIEDLLRKHELHKYGRTVGVRDFFPENGIAYLGTYGDDGLPYKTLCLRWGPALKK